MRLSQYLKCKLHHARVTYTNPEYVGSVEIDRSLMNRIGLDDGELVHIWAVDREARLITYAFGGPPGVIGLNGGAAHTFRVGERVIIAAFDLADEPIVPKQILLDADNRFVRDMAPFDVVG